MKFKLEFDMDNDAFWLEDDEPHFLTPVEVDYQEVRRTLNQVGDRVALYTPTEVGEPCTIRDINGHIIGKWEIINDET